MPWLAVLVLTLAACRFQLEDGAPTPPPAARTQDPRCLEGGTWNDSTAVCEYDDKRPPAAPIPKVSTGR